MLVCECPPPKGGGSGAASSRPEHGGGYAAAVRRPDPALAGAAPPPQGGLVTYPISRTSLEYNKTSDVSHRVVGWGRVGWSVGVVGGVNVRCGVLRLLVVVVGGVVAVVAVVRLRALLFACCSHVVRLLVGRWGSGCLLVGRLSGGGDGTVRLGCFVCSCCCFVRFFYCSFTLFLLFFYCSATVLPLVL